MLSEEEYINILDNLSTAVGVSKPVYDENGELVDFVVEYVNYSFQHLTRSLILPGMVFSEFREMLSPELDWSMMAINTSSSHATLVKTFYSSLFNCWMSLSMNGVLESYVAITLQNVNDFKDYEQQLKRQNLRLEAVTEELNLSRNDLRNQLFNVKLLNSQLQESALHDPMTNLFNRKMYNTYVEEAKSRADKNGTKFGLLIFDIDNLKVINDSRSHVEGDKVIHQVARVLRKFETNCITPFRFSGDDFIILYQDIDGKKTMKEFSKMLIHELNENDVCASVGIAVYPEDTTDISDLHKFADLAKSEVKKNGKNNFSFFHHVMKEKFFSKMNLETKLAKALSNNVFQLYFQPQFILDSNKLRGFEALLRWYDEDLGWISPDKFIPVAEESRIVIPLGDWVIEEAFKTLHAWSNRYCFEGIMCINVSPVQFNKEDFITSLKEKIETHKINPKQVELEITEGILIDNMDETIRKLKEIRAMGIGIALDDFGTGYSSLRYLQQLPLTSLKIDRSFISNINNKDGVEADITETIVNLVSKMGLDTIAEGVETDEQLAVLKGINCKSIQGFLKGKPMPRNDCEKVFDDTDPYPEE